MQNHTPSLFSQLRAAGTFIFSLAVAMTVIAAITISSNSAVAQVTDVSSFETCKSFRAGQASDTAVEDFCACTAAQLQIFSNEQKKNPSGEIDILGVQQEAQLSREVEIQKIQGPCAYIIAKDKTFNSCKENPQYDSYIKTKGVKTKMCNCIANETESFFKDLAEARLGVLLNNPVLQVNDAVTAIMTDSVFMRASRDFNKSCFNKYAE